MAATIINLDEMIPEDRFVQYKGKQHKLEVTSTETYLKIVKTRQKLGKTADDDEIAQTELAIEMLGLALPTISRNDILKLPLKAMMRLVDVVQSEMELAEEQQVEGAVDGLRSEQAIDVTPNGEPPMLSESTLALSSLA